MASRRCPSYLSSVPPGAGTAWRSGSDRIEPGIGARAPHRPLAAGGAEPEAAPAAVAAGARRQADPAARAGAGARHHPADPVRRLRLVVVLPQAGTSGPGADLRPGS